MITRNLVIKKRKIGINIIFQVLFIINIIIMFKDHSDEIFDSVHVLIIKYFKR